MRNTSDQPEGEVTLQGSTALVSRRPPTHNMGTIRRGKFGIYGNADHGLFRQT